MTTYTYDSFGNRFDSKGRVVFYQSEWNKPVGTYHDEFGNEQVVIADPKSNSSAKHVPYSLTASKRKRKKAGKRKGSKGSGYCSKCKGPHVYKHGRA